MGSTLESTFLKKLRVACFAIFVCWRNYVQKWILGFACFCMDCHATAIALARNDRKKAESVKVDSKENAQDSVIASFVR
ncbi:hypothetical protein [Helicobacter zhangjianzhongii]|uniref:Uncharacterized protein n=1 Tax=Helicobacter zhangjianzhongii TaxID=2974574 RepID=A0ACC6FV20_9HELI|nr:MULTISPECIES: hypothetical protein [unclassified Helicobacter]MDL0080520.1 hypothetical protein [Helicobacter sp. CPD2-1]MDL0082840.1 hypothetical protein [Helicobacter sp. XJK30-2]